MKLLTTKEAAERLGLKSTSSLRNAISKGQLRAIKPGHDYLIKESDLMKWVNGNDHRGVSKTRTKTP